MVNMISENSPRQMTNNQRKAPFFIGVSGGTASGKTTVCDKVIEQIGGDPKMTSTRVAILYADIFYKDLSENNLKLASQGKFNFDHPNAIDFDLFVETIRKLQRGDPIVQVPIYSYVENRRTGWTDFMNADVVIVEGILIFYDQRIRNIFELKIFVDCDADTRLARRVIRDISERGRNIETVLTQYTELVKPAFEDFCLPTKKYADIILPRGRENMVAINLFSQHVHDLLNGSIDNRLRRLNLAKIGIPATPSPTSPGNSPTSELVNFEKSPLANGRKTDINQEKKQKDRSRSNSVEVIDIDIDEKQFNRQISIGSHEVGPAGEMGHLNSSRPH